MHLIEGFSLANYFLQYILLLVLIGILTVEFSRRKNELKKGILGFLILTISITLFITLDLFRVLLEIQAKSFLIFLVSLNVFQLLLLIITSIRVWKKINKILFFAIPLFVIGIIGFEYLLNFLRISSAEILNIVSVAGATILYYFLIVTFLINSSSKNFSVNKKKVKSSKKTIIVLLMSILLILLAVFIFNSNNFSFEILSPEINIYNWEDYLGENTIEDFEEEFGVKVNVYGFEDEYVLLEEDLSNYDLIVVSDVLVDEMVEKNMIQEIDKTNVPYLKNVHESCEFGTKENRNYVVPYLWGTTGLVVNTDKIPLEEANTWGVLWDPRYEGKILMLNNPDEVIGAASKYIGNNLVPMSLKELNEVEEFLLLQKPLILGYEEDRIHVDKFLNEEVWVAHEYGGFPQWNEMDDNFVYVIPKEGGSKWVEYFSIPVGVSEERKYTAEVFINFIQRQDVMAEIADYQWSASCNLDAEELMDPGIFEDKSIYPDEIIGSRLQFFSDFKMPDEVREERDRFFFEDLIGSFESGENEEEEGGIEDETE